MEERQTQIREQAGLTESKLNVEFIDWLKRWSTPLMLVLLAGALGILAYQRYQKFQGEKLDAAFRELEAASTGNANPDSLRAIAETYPGVRAVPLLARLRAADQYLRSVRLGARTGAKPGDTGAFPAEEVLTEQDRTAYLAQAEDLYKQVLAETASDTSKAVHALAGAYGLASVAECRGQFDDAKKFYEQAAQIADRAGFPAQVQIARKRIEQLPALAKARFPSKSELPPEPAPTPAPEAVPGPVQTPAAPAGSEIPDLKPPNLELKPTTPAATPAAAPGAEQPKNDPAPAAPPAPSPAPPK